MHHNRLPVLASAGITHYRQAHRRPFVCVTMPRLRLITMKDDMFHNKTVFSSALSDQFRISSKWRASQAQRFKHDARNVKAAERLLEFEARIEVTDEAWIRIAPLVSDSACLAAISDTNRDVEFRAFPRDFSAWLDQLQTNLTLRSVVA
jgi:hypothetical protein